MRKIVFLGFLIFFILLREYLQFINKNCVDLQRGINFEKVNAQIYFLLRLCVISTVSERYYEKEILPSVQTILKNQKYNWFREKVVCTL